MLSGKRHLTVYFNLISKALTNDADNKDYGEVRDKRGGTRTSAAGGAISIAKRLLHTAQHAGLAPGLAAAVLLVSEALRYRPALRRDFNGVKGEGENDNGGGGEGMVW